MGNMQKKYRNICIYAKKVVTLPRICGITESRNPGIQNETIKDI